MVYYHLSLHCSRMLCKRSGVYSHHCLVSLEDGSPRWECGPTMTCHQVSPVPGEVPRTIYSDAIKDTGGNDWYLREGRWCWARVVSKEEQRWHCQNTYIQSYGNVLLWPLGHPHFPAQKTILRGESSSCHPVAPSTLPSNTREREDPGWHCHLPLRTKETTLSCEVLFWWLRWLLKGDKAFWKQEAFIK